MNKQNIENTIKETKTLEEILEILSSMETLKGDPGKDGETPVRGKDYFTEAEIKGLQNFILDNIPKIDKAAISDEIVIEIGKQIAKLPKPKDGKNPSKAELVKMIKDAMPEPVKPEPKDTPKQIVEKINSSKSKIDKKQIKGLKAIEKQVVENADAINDLEKNIQNRVVQYIGNVGGEGTGTGDGTPGADGVDGKTILNGTAVPTTEGVDGDFYIKTDTNEIYGPKTGGAWGAATSLVGPQGPAGADGPQGPAGETGPEGPQGPQGIPGVAGGSMSWRGAWATATAYSVDDSFEHNGSSYIVRTAHTSSATTEPGTGATWDTVMDLVAAKGDQGPTGPQGVPGPQGDQGIQGIQGPAGNDGADGQDGATGPQGPQGIQGEKGDTGDTGPAGPTGPTGPQGATGPAGADGAGLPTGGTTGQVATKQSNADHDVIWTDPTGGTPTDGLQFAQLKSWGTKNTGKITINAEVYNPDSILTYSGTEITLTEGKYRVQSVSMTYDSGTGHTSFRRSSDDAVLWNSTYAISDTSDPSGSNAIIDGFIDVPSGGDTYHFYETGGSSSNGSSTNPGFQATFTKLPASGLQGAQGATGIQGLAGPAGPIGPAGPSTAAYAAVPQNHIFTGGNTKIPIAYTDNLDIKLHLYSTTTLTIVNGSQTRRFVTATDFPGTNSTIGNAIIANNKVYIWRYQSSPAAWKLFAIEGVDNLATATITEVDISGVYAMLSGTSNLRIGFDGTHFYFNYGGGQTGKTAYDVRKCSIASNVLTTVSDFTLDTATYVAGLNASGTWVVDRAGNFHGTDTGEDWAMWDATGTLIHDYNVFHPAGFNYLDHYFDGTNSHLYIGQSNNNYPSHKFYRF